MLIRFGGGKKGISDYLKSGQKSDREYSRNELDKRVILSGNLDELDFILSEFDIDNIYEKYMHITLSFKEKFISEEMLFSINEEFKKFIFKACHEDEFYYYSEAHLPKIKKIFGKDGKEYDRFPHIHIVIPEFNLLTGKKENHLGKIQKINNYIDAFQEYINQKYNLESPKNNKREEYVGKAGIIKRNEKFPKLKKDEVKNFIFEIIKKDLNIKSLEDLSLILHEYGVVSIRDSKSFGQRYINFKPYGFEKGINLKDNIFLEDYLINRNLNNIKNYVDLNIIDKWNNFKSLEIRFVDRKSKKIQMSYQKLSNDEKRIFLQKSFDNLINKENETFFNLMKNEEYVYEMDHDYYHINDFIHIDDICHFDSLQKDQDIEHLDRKLSNEQSRESGESAVHGDSMSELHPWNNHESRDEWFDGKQNILPTAEGSDLERGKENSSQTLFSSTTIEKKLITRDENWTERINQIDLSQFLNYLSQKYGLDIYDYEIVKTDEQRNRIIFNGKKYSASDFLTKHLNLSWNESKEMLSLFLEKQKDFLYKDRQSNNPSLWKDFIKNDTIKKNDTRKIQERYLDWLYDEAKKGKWSALTELKSIYPFDKKDNFLYFRPIKLVLENFKPYDFGVKTNILGNGNIVYDGLMIDKGNSISMNCTMTKENLEKAFELAKIRFGKDNFDIVNAKLDDLRIIKNIVSKSNLKIKVYTNDGKEQKLSIEKER